MLRKLEKYDLLEEIGHGGMATVYRARDSRLEREVAVKVMHPHLHKAPEAKSRFAREARSVARLKHENILEIYDYSGEESDESWISAELLTGPTLKRFGELHPNIPAEIAAAFCIEIAEALEAAHQKGIVHRDVKPENVLLHQDRLVKLTDFGIAQMVDAQSMTATGQILGSPGHMAPEQVDGRDIDHRSDIFALGTVLYYLAVGRLPFTGRNPHAILKRVMDSDYPDPLRARPTIGGDLARIIAKALSREPADRFATAEEMKDELVAFVARSGVDDSAAALAAYLKSPEVEAEALRKKVIGRLTDTGEKALSAQDVPTALDCFNRVLALDEGNDRVLGLLERVGRREARRRNLFIAAGLMLGISGLGAIGYAAWGPGPDDERTDPRIVPETADRDSGLARDTSDGGPLDAAVAAVVDAATVVPVKAVPTKIPPLRSDRVVIFNPDPDNVLISIDGQAEQPWGTFRSATLSLGRHTVRFRPGPELDNRKEVTFTFDLRGGDDPFPVSRSLGWADAILYIRTSVPASVQVRGRTSENMLNHTLVVPMRAEREDVTYTVTAEGFRTITTSVGLTAGGSSDRLSHSLQPAEGVP